jgi:8-oxo-dGTP pyrophosphatase MutT (NUDIX family)
MTKAVGMRTKVIAKTAVFNAGGEILVLTRSDDDLHRPGGLDFPGGNIEKGEEIIAGALRELSEEAGLQIAATDIKAGFARTYIGLNADTGQQANFVWLGFVARQPVGQEPVISHEHSGCRWMLPEDYVQATDSKTQKLFIAHLLSNDVLAGLIS